MSEPLNCDQLTKFRDDDRRWVRKGSRWQRRLLLAEVDRLTRERDEARAALVITDEMIERAAHAMHVWNYGGVYGWDEASESEQKLRHDEARAALEAALNPGA